MVEVSWNLLLSAHTHDLNEKHSCKTGPIVWGLVDRSYQLSRMECGLQTH